MAKKKVTELEQELELEVENVQPDEEGLEELETPRDGEGNELLFPDGPTLAKIEEWKSRYKDIYFTEFEEEAFIWRCLERGEYKNVMKIQGADQFYKEERICERCILWPEKYDFKAMSGGKAGIPTFISEQILDKSGFTARAAALKL